ncbi:hypothetical protein P9139_20110 [Curtobacterium flaccumfaciens]|nr:hypothetical protein P9139_20110 [Curtobacterium flaccumfaciens]
MPLHEEPGDAECRSDRGTDAGARIREPQTIASSVPLPVRVSPAMTWSKPIRLLPRSRLAIAIRASTTTRATITSARRRSAARWTPRAAIGAVALTSGTGARAGVGAGTENILG